MASEAKGSVSLQQTPPAGAIATKVPDDLRGSWGSEGTDDSDILIPRLLLMQGLSPAVAEGKVAQGDIVRSTLKEHVLGGKGKKVEFIPITTFKTWVLSEKVGNKYEFRSITPMTAANKDEPLEFMVNGQQWRRDRALNFYVLLPEDIKRELKAMEVAKAGGMPDPDDALIPHVVSFRRTSYPAGKDLATHFKKAEHFNVSPAVKTFYLDSEVQKNDQGIYQVFKVVKARDTTVEELAVAKRWYDTLQKAKVRIDEDEMDEGSSGSGAASAAPVDGGKETF